MDVTKPGLGWEGPELAGSEQSVQQEQRHRERHGWCIFSQQHLLEPRELGDGAAIEIAPPPSYPGLGLNRYTASCGNLHHGIQLGW